MKRRNSTAKWVKYGLFAVTMVFGILPGGCETIILRFATPFLI